MLAPYRADQVRSRRISASRFVTRVTGNAVVMSA